MRKLRDRAAMFVANHSSFMDIPFVGTSIGWRNYKFISKAELGKVPILGRSIKVGGNVMLDRTNRRSQLMTLKNGIQWLKVCGIDSLSYLLPKCFILKMFFAILTGWSSSCHIPRRN
jgi:1-acyl-sn-glycerol-3-phosphate acyltransferase